MPTVTQRSYDVIVVGAGPVGMTLSALLGRAGHSVRLIDRYESLYGMPRAAHYDHEIARILAAVGLRDQLAQFSQPAGKYDWQNADGDLLLRFDWSQPGRSAWPTANMFSQPGLEEALDSLVCSLPSVDVVRGEAAVSLTQSRSLVEVEVRGIAGPQLLTAQYVVGCDGGSSFVRTAMNVTDTDLGFFYDWLICDVIPLEAREWQPTNLQICDPQRPTSVLSGGPGRRRWEFMRRPDETVDQLNTPETAWRLLERWNLTPENARLERHAVYTFQARWVDNWRDGRCFLAGDAAHLMPPFAGQGMCSGLRDAMNLAWKLSFVLNGTAEEKLLDSYSTERLAHVKHAIGMSVELGRVICETDANKVAERDKAMIAGGADPARVLPPLPDEMLGPGVLQSKGGQPLAPAGRLSFQGYVADHSGSMQRLDELAGTGFRLLTAKDPTALLGEERLLFLMAIGARVILLVPPGQWREAEDELVTTVVESDGQYFEYLREVDGDAVIIRPDFYVYGVAKALEELPSLVDELAHDLGARVGGARPSVGAHAPR